MNQYCNERVHVLVHVPQKGLVLLGLRRLLILLLSLRKGDADANDLLILDPVKRKLIEGRLRQVRFEVRQKKAVLLVVLGVTFQQREFSLNTKVKQCLQRKIGLMVHDEKRKQKEHVRSCHWDEKGPRILQHRVLGGTQTTSNEDRR